MNPSDRARFVFLDPRGKRWPRLRLALLVTVVLIFTGSVVFVQSLFIAPHLKIPASVTQLKERLKTMQSQDAILQPVAKKPVWLEFVRPAQATFKNSPQKIRQTRAASDTRQICVGFYVGWDPNSLGSLKPHSRHLTHICPEWLTLLDASGKLDVTPDMNVIDYARENRIELMLLLNNLSGDNWLPEAVEGLARGPEAARLTFIAQLIQHLAYADAGGLIIDWGQVDPEYRTDVTRLLQQIAVALHQADMQVWLRVPMGRELKVFDLDTLSNDLDYFIATLHDENSESDLPGPIASQEWFEGWLGAMMGYGQPGQWIIEMGSYGYDWSSGIQKPESDDTSIVSTKTNRAIWETSVQKAETLSFSDVMTRANRAGIASCKSDKPVYNPSFDYSDSGIHHKVWFLDAATFMNQLIASRKYPIGGIGIYQLGAEDPAIWGVLQASGDGRMSSEDLRLLAPLKADALTGNVGKGEFVTVEDAQEDGQRRLAADDSGRIGEVYEKFPAYLTLSRQGAGQEDEVAISFDDGPDPRWTPQILDILKVKGVKASFFVVGSQAEKYPDLVRRILNEGHEIGSHTYTHPNLAQVSEERITLELNATQRLIEALTGRSTILFRPPYNADSRPSGRNEILPLKTAQRLGYLTVMENIDPEDWARPGPAEIVNRVRQARQLGDNLILLHDAGGDRHQTIEALPAIIDYIDNRGDRVVSLAKMLGETPEHLMPHVIKAQQPVTRLISSGGFQVIHTVQQFLWAFMVVSTILVIVRTLVVVALAGRNKKHRTSLSSRPFLPAVSILIAAFNEAKVIRNTLTSVLNTAYPGEIELWVVDDGSTDDTAKIVSEFTQKDSRVSLIRQANQGKATALRTGLERTSHDMVVMLDADTRFQPDTLSNLISPLQDERIAAVSGHARVGNLKTFVGRCQSLEYAFGFNLDRRAYDEINGITVLPGAINAVRKQALIQAGGVSTDTLAEDTDFTLCLHRAGFRVVYAPQAIAWTEVPESWAGLVRQRFRWAFGTLQCLWKHRDMAFNIHYRALGCFSLPSVWFFHILLVAVSPVIDLIFLLSVILGISSYPIYVYFFIFLLTDLLLALLALRMEKEPLRQAWLIIPMRFIYRPILSWVVWKSLIRALKGAWVGWGKVERTAAA
ncbi:MAG: glycosyltransferase [Desulfatirhabdiaceae bacterium]